MRSGTLKATGLGSKSFEGDEGVALSPRRQLDFECPAHHRFSIVFSDEAQLPTAWDCPTCWATAVRSDGVTSVAPDVKPTRTHWDMLRERRSVAELEEILAERLALLKAGTIGPNAYERIAIAGKRKAG
ncbi:RNA polymerase-binding protein [Friedmanniella luteola]|uniref:RNA polymerase-binding protein RbpA n=1 Tax=Friedmanniella luteola TaxID=546871 RepID=A0A1H1MRN4_9ACTN|nr:RNA polymerase-binding protein RbpA [Friedmanniella luteola]SDR89593.1 RNA polymerase-binding protein [Friedmanniella luteola]